MLGDFFKIQNQEDLNQKQLNDLIIEARRIHVTNRETPSRKRLDRVHEELEAQRIQREQERLDMIKDEKKRIEKSNQIAEQLERREEREADIEERIEQTIKRFTETREQKRAYQAEEHQKRIEEKEAIRLDAKERGSANREERAQIAQNAEDRSAEAREKDKEFLENIEARRDAEHERLAERRDKIDTQEDKQAEVAQERKAANREMLQTAGEFSDKIRKIKEAVIEAARSRSDDREKLAGLPQEKNEYYQTVKKEIQEAADARHEPIAEMFDKAYAEIFEKLKARIDLAFEKGDIHRDEKNFIINKAKGILAEFFHTMLVRRWLNIFTVDRSERSEQRTFEYIGLMIYHELLTRRTDELVSDLQNDMTETKEDLTKRHENALAFDQYLEQRRANTYPYSPGVTGNLISDADKSYTLYEKYLETLIKNNRIEKEKNEPPLHTGMNDLVTYLEDIETRHPDAESVRETDRSQPSSPDRNPNKEFKDIITFVDDPSSEQDKEILIEYVARLRESAAQLPADRIADEDTVKKYNDEKTRRDALLDEEKKLLMKHYYETLIASQNKTAHEKAVELGQFINLFF